MIIMKNVKCIKKNMEIMMNDETDENIGELF